MPFGGHILEWSARLHEIGLDISHYYFQKHGAYIVENADLPGFPRSEQAILAFIIATHRGQFDLQLPDKLPTAWQETALRIAIVHRLAVLLNRSRSTRDLPRIVLDVAGNSIRLGFPEEWLKANPLTVADLERERKDLENIRFELFFA